MGYPMTYPRVVNRNMLQGDYGYEPGMDRVEALRHLVSGDLRRLESDQRDEKHLAKYAAAAGITDHQAYLVLSAFFSDFAEAP